MTSYERLLCAVAGQKPDRAPAAPEVFGVTARLCGRRIRDYVSDGRVIAESQTAVRAELGYDILFAFADLSVEAEALGCSLIFEDDAYPAVQAPIVRDKGDIAWLALPDPSRSGRMPVVTEACRLLREAAGSECVIAACVMGPVSTASQLMGLEAFLYLLADRPLDAGRLLDFTEQTTLEYGKGLIAAGAHCLVVFDPIASPAVLPPALFALHEAPRLMRIFERFKSEGALISWVSIAGATQKILPLFPKLGIDLATIDYEVPVAEGFRLAGGMALNGNIKPFSFVSAQPGEIKQMARACLRDAGERRNFIAGSGCEVPVESGRENLRAFVEAVKEVG